MLGDQFLLFSHPLRAARPWANFTNLFQVTKSAFTIESRLFLPFGLLTVERRTGPTRSGQDEHQANCRSPPPVKESVHRDC
jgi:hypothetical protein